MVWAVPVAIAMGAALCVTDIQDTVIALLDILDIRAGNVCETNTSVTLIVQHTWGYN